MAEQILPSPETLRQILTYDSQSGELHWEHRPQSHFATHNAFATWNSIHAGKKAFSTPKQGYLVGCVFSRRIFAHRVIWAIYHGEWPANVIDHINGDGTDNRIANLRSVTRMENAKNTKRHKNNKSGHMGICWLEDRRRWQVDICANGVKKNVGRFAILDEAIAARRTAEESNGFHPNHGR